MRKWSFAVLIPFFLMLGLVVSPRARAEEEEKPAAAAEATHEGEKPAGEGSAEAKPEGSSSAEHEHDPAAPAASASGSAGEDENESPEEAKAHHTLDPMVYADFIKKKIEEAREKVLAKMIAKIQDKQAAKMQKLTFWLAMFSLSGFLLLFIPFFVMKKYPGKLGLLFKYSGIAAIICVLVINLFAGVILTLRGVQGSLGELTNPQIKITEATFDALIESTDNLLAFGKDLVEPTMKAMAGETEEQIDPEDPPAAVLMENVKNMKGDFEAIISIAKFFKSVSWLFQYIPIVLLIVAVVLFAVSAKPVFAALISLPGRVAGGEEGAAKSVIKEAFLRVWHELLATFCLIGLLVGVTLMSETLLTQVVQPAVETLLEYFFMCIVYLKEEQGASSMVIKLSLGGTIMFLVLNLLLIIISSAFYLGKAHKILQQKFHDKIPLKAHKKFWLWGTLAVIWIQVFPLLFLLAVNPLVDKLLDKATEKGDHSWNFILLSGPGLLVFAFLFSFWAVRGFKGLGFMLKYKPPVVMKEFLEGPTPPAQPAAAGAQ